MAKRLSKFSSRQRINHSYPDTILILFFSIHLYFMFPYHDEGEMTTYRGSIVQNKNLTLLAKVRTTGFYHILSYYIPITDTSLELSVFWPTDTESRINELRFSESISLSFKTRLMSVTCFCGDVT